MKITRPNDPGPLEVLEVAQPLEAAEPAPAPVETPVQIEERREAESAALSGTRSLLTELQSRLATVTAQANEHRQCANTPFAGDPGALAAHLATTEQHRADADRLAVEAESLQRQCIVAAALLDKLVLEQEQEQTARTQAAGRVLLADAMKRYVEAAANLADVVVDLGAASIAANMSGSFAASVRAMLLPDMTALGAALPALPGFRRQREGQAVATADPAFQRRMNEVFSRGISI